MARSACAVLAVPSRGWTRAPESGGRPRRAPWVSGAEAPSWLPLAPHRSFHVSLLALWFRSAAAPSAYFSLLYSYSILYSAPLEYSTLYATLDSRVEYSF
eukprot:scaffold124263_cov35-Tisochrysis_lutea.AAC.1